MYSNLLKQNPQHEELLRKVLQKVEEVKRPADEVVLDDVDLQNFLNISKRTIATLREKRKITYSKPDGRVYYLLSDILNYVRKNQVKAMDEEVKIKL